MKKTFSLFQSHLDLAHQYWTQLIQIGDTVIDATCGNGHDTLKLCQLALSEDKGKIYAIDAQSIAIESAKMLLEHHLSADLQKRVEFHLGCHSTFPSPIESEAVKLIVYNLGYLPGGNKAKTTTCSTTLQSVQHACTVLKAGGAISVTCYPGHPEGAREQEAILKFASGLAPTEWSCCHHTWNNRHLAPSLLLLQKCVKSDNSPVA